MLEPLEPAVLRLLRVPPEPTPPAGAAGSLQTFRAAPRYFLYRQLVWGLKQLGALAALLFGLLFVEEVAPHVKGLSFLHPWLRVGEAIAWALFLLQLPFSYVVMRLDYRLRWYMVTDRSLRVREGILSLREKTMTFANVQQLSVEQGPLQRLLGLADVHLQSAGGGAAKAGKKGEAGVGESPHEARFRGVANAAELRDLVRERVRRYRDAGLGDHGDVVMRPPSATTAADDTLAAAQELLAEARGLRGVLTGPRP
jgi:membrane protein YdbS with pleckstrin-like domain